MLETAIEHLEKALAILDDLTPDETVEELRLSFAAADLGRLIGKLKACLQPPR